MDSSFVSFLFTLGVLQLGCCSRTVAGLPLAREIARSGAAALPLGQYRTSQRRVIVSSAEKETETCCTSDANRILGILPFPNSQIESTRPICHSRIADGIDGHFVGHVGNVQDPSLLDSQCRLFRTPNRQLMCKYQMVGADGACVM